jgi:hypothetical protein
MTDSFLPVYRDMVRTYSQLMAFDELVGLGTSPSQAVEIVGRMCIDYANEAGFLADIIPDGARPPYPFTGRRPV